jgi:hypothetical protein
LCRAAAQVFAHRAKTLALVEFARDFVGGDVQAHFDPTFVRDDVVEIILNNYWPE